MKKNRVEESQGVSLKEKALDWMKNNPTQAKVAAVAVLVVLFCIIFVTCKGSDEQPATAELPATTEKNTAATVPETIPAPTPIPALPEENVEALPASHTVTLPGNIQLNLAKINSGSYMKGRAGSKHYHQKHVEIPDDFYVGVYEITQAQYQAVMNKNPARFKDGQKPVENVSWNEATMFCDRLNQDGHALVGWKFALPTSDQWEYACRAGSSTSYAFGESLAGKANFNGKKGTKAVGSYISGGNGLYDMHGNVWEWCLDSHGKNKEIRGGAWNSKEIYCASYLFGKSAPTKKNDAIGFRVVMVKAD